MNVTDRLVWQPVPAADDPTIPTKADIAAALKSRPGQPALVQTHDRKARAEAHVVRITTGAEYGTGFDAAYRQIGGDHRVYAWSL